MSIDLQHLDTLRHERWHDRVQFRFKTTLFQARRVLQDALARDAQRHHRGAALADAPVLAESITPLWTMLDGESPHLTAGKVQNLRRAVQDLDGVVLAENAVFSFWRQLGKTSRRRGYVDGRELRSGCLVPTIGGGLCQLSCALYQVAVQAGMQVIERHAHRQRLNGVAGFPEFDATVFWNYIDLRWRSPFPTRLHARLDADHLTVRLHGHAPNRRISIQSALVESLDHVASVLRPAVVIDGAPSDCESCDATDCSRQQPRTQVDQGTCILIDERWPEFVQWLAQKAPFGRTVATWQRSARALPDATTVGHVGALHSTIDMRIAQWLGQPAARARMRRDERMASIMAHALEVDDRQLVVAQTLLPWLWKLGVLGGRRFEVLMTRASMADIHALLERARQCWPESTTLGDFRAPTELVEAEAEALSYAARRIGAHPMWLQKGDLRLPWQLPKAADDAMLEPRDKLPRRVLFPMTTLARNGACLLRDATRDTNVTLQLGGPVLESDDFWRGISVQQTPRDEWNLATMAVIPSLLPSRSQAALALISAGIPILATPEAGLDGLPGVRVVAGDDPAQWRDAIAQMLAEPA